MSPLLIGALAYAAIITVLALAFLYCCDENRKRANAAEDRARRAIAELASTNLTVTRLCADRERLRAVIAELRPRYADAGLVREVEAEEPSLTHDRLMFEQIVANEGWES